MLPDTLAPLLLALLIDASIGYPGALWRRIGHPVGWIATLIALADNCFTGRGKPRRHERKLAGILSLVAIVGVSVSCAMALVLLLKVVPGGWVLEGMIVSSLLASRSLYERIHHVTVALEGQALDAARRSVSRMAGRDLDVLDKNGVARIAVEGLAEKASNAILAPALWFAVLGLPGLAAYKAINTAHAMLGRRTGGRDAFGWASARLDHIVNLPASRVTAALFMVAAAMLPRASAKGAALASFRAAGRHRFPHAAAWPKNAMAGALGLRLGGSRVKGGLAVADAYLGHGRAEAEAADIRRALGLALTAWALMVGLVGTAALACEAAQNSHTETTRKIRC